MKWLDIILTILPTFLSAIGVVIHFVVAHRLKCEKSILECLKTCVPDILPSDKTMKFKDIQPVLDKIEVVPDKATLAELQDLENRVAELHELAETVKELTELLKGGVSNG